MKNTTINGLDLNRLGTSDIYSLSLVLNWISGHGNLVEIQNIGYNENSGNIYAVFCDGDTIFSSFGQPVQFETYDNENDEVLELTEKDFITRNTIQSI